MTPTPAYRRVAIALGVGATVAVLGVLISLYFSHSHPYVYETAPIPAPAKDVADVRLARPDALIVSTSLRDLPRDLLKVPLLKAVLTEDFVFYYRRNSHLLGIEGTLRRIAYEHHLNLRDDAIALLLDRPADVALWRGRDGRLSHWLIDTASPAWLPLLKLVDDLNGNDPAIRRVGTLPLPGDGSVSLYQLNYGLNRSIDFASANDHLVLFSDSAMINDDRYGDADGRAQFWHALLSSAHALSPLRSHFGLQAFNGKHTLLIDADAVSFNYRQFTPDIEALRFDFDGEHWASFLRLAPHAAAGFATKPIWHALPDNPGLCASAPLDLSRLRPTLLRLHGANPHIDPSLAGAFGNPGAICWFADGTIYTPMLLLRIGDGANWDESLAALFADGIGNSWPRYRDERGSVADTATAVPGAERTWVKSVKTDYGEYTVILARAHGWLVFSADANAVRNTVAAIARQRPTIADLLSRSDDRVIAVMTPAALSQLLRHAIDGDLPENAQPLFHKAAAERLVPRLLALTRFPPYALALPTALDTTHRYWQPIAWHALSPAH